jgi:hypothetical protein
MTLEDEDVSDEVADVLREKGITMPTSAALPRGSMTAARSAGWSSAALTPGSWPAWP